MMLLRSTLVTFSFLLCVTKWSNVIGSSVNNLYFNGFPCVGNSLPDGFFDLVSHLTKVNSFSAKSRLHCLTHLLTRDTRSSFSLILASYRLLRDPTLWRCLRFEPLTAAEGDTASSTTESDMLSEDMLIETCMLTFPSASSCETYEGEGRQVMVLLTPPTSQVGTLASCDLDTSGGGWTVIQRRQDGSVVFFRGWETYKSGFGDISGEFWFGLENIHNLVSAGSYELRFDMMTESGEARYAVYQYFSIGGEELDYQLTITGYSGDAGDFLSEFNGAFFSSADRETPSGHFKCAFECQCGFWFSDLTGCSNGNPNAVYGNIFWPNFSETEKEIYPLSFVEIKIRPTTDDTGLVP